MDALAYRAGFVLGLACLARHARAPGQHAGAVAAPRQAGVGTMLGLSGWTEHLDVLGMRPLDIFCAAKAAVEKMTLRQTSGTRALPLQHRLHQAAIGPDIADFGVNDDLLAGHARHLHVVGRVE